MGNERWISFRARHLETDLWIAVSSGKYVPDVEPYALYRIIYYREILDLHIRKHPEFHTSLIPLEPVAGCHPLIKVMYEASSTAGTGPMSAVAGAVAECICNDLLSEFGMDEAVVENGGDIFMKISRPATISIYAGESPLSDRIGIVAMPGQSPLSICCSSATVGHSLSFGTADAAVIACRSGALADAYATACCNAVKDLTMIGEVTGEFLTKPGIMSVIIIKEDKVGIAGEMEITML